MNKFKLQGELFKNNALNYSINKENKELMIGNKVIKNWQNRIITYQEKILENGIQDLSQFSLFETQSKGLINKFSPFDLTPIALSFWRLPNSPHKGPAIYFVMDKLNNRRKNIILYIGETLSAEKRWKGTHDCKAYLSNYSEALQKAGLTSQLNIRFCIDVPEQTKERRKLEQKLIQTWLPPFNKETRANWSTPFTSEIN